LLVFPKNPPIDPSFRITRWQGIIKGRGLFFSTVPMAWYALE